MKFYSVPPIFRKRWLLIPLALFAFAIAPISQAGLTGYMKIPDIPGESQRIEHEDEIDIHGISWKVQADAQADGSGRTVSRAKFSAITIEKDYDASSPYLFLSTAQRKSFDEIILTFTRSSGEGAPFAYLTITLENCVLTSYEVTGKLSAESRPTEEVSLVFEKINIKYVVQADDHSAGDEHEIEYDVAAGI